MNEIVHKIKGYLGYKVPVNIAGDLFYKNPETLDECLEDLTLNSLNEYIETRDIKLKLRPLDSLTNKELINNFDIDYSYYDKPKDLVKNFYLTAKLKEFTMAEIEYFHKNHIDYQNLIGQGLAIKKEQE